MTKIYKKQESLEAYEQLTLRPDKLPSTTRQTVLDRALGSWRAVNHAACSRGFVSNGIANKLDGTEDETLTLEVTEYWAELKMHRLRAKVMDEVAKLVAEGKRVFAGAGEKLATSSESQTKKLEPPTDVWSSKPFSVESRAMIQVSFVPAVYGATELMPPLALPAIGLYGGFQRLVAEIRMSLKRARKGLTAQGEVLTFS